MERPGPGSHFTHTHTHTHARTYTHMLTHTYRTASTETHTLSSTILEIKVPKGFLLKAQGSTQDYLFLKKKKTFFEEKFCQGLFVRTLLGGKRSIKIAEILEELFHQGFFVP